MFKLGLASACTLLLLLSVPTPCSADVDSGCPSWGCLPWGSFSLSAGIPSTNSKIQWRVDLETMPSSSDISPVPRGCVSDQQSVVCTTENGYVSVDPTNGKKLWSYTTMSAPYLPIMDIYSDVIGMDSKAMYYVGGDGKPKQPIRVGILKPQYSLMVSNNSIMLITGSSNKTAQIVTYDTDGIVDGAIQLRDSVENNINGTFIPFSQPIIAGFRAYVMTYFIPDDINSKGAQRVSGKLRLYAIDVLHQLMPRIVIAWHFDYSSLRRTPMTSQHAFQSHNSRRLPLNNNLLEPIVTYFSGSVYVNVPGNWDEFSQQRSDKVEPYQGLLWAIRDDGTKGTLLFRTSSLFGPMAVYDTYDNPLSKRGKLQKASEDEHLLWIVCRSPPIIQGYSTRNGTIKDIKGFDYIFEKLGGWITSRLSITRSTASPKNDQLVFGMTDIVGQASIVVVEVEGDTAKLALTRVVSQSRSLAVEERRAIVEGQIVNFAFYPPGHEQKGGSNGNEEDTWTLGLAAVVTETNSTSINRAVVGVF